MRWQPNPMPERLLREPGQPLTSAPRGQAHDESQADRGEGRGDDAGEPRHAAVGACEHAVQRGERPDGERQVVRPAPDGARQLLAEEVRQPDGGHQLGGGHAEPDRERPVRGRERHEHLAERRSGRRGRGGATLPCSVTKIPVRIARKRCTSSTAKRGQVKLARADISTPRITEAERSRYATSPAERAKYQTAGDIRPQADQARTAARSASVGLRRDGRRSAPRGRAGRAMTARPARGGAQPSRQRRPRRSLGRPR